ncbi:hypothetical protein [Methylobacterium nigriterrae]|uniref:hypothetical protein n=1 Tax=Methylobacterium nigriterrae TaxID=3127512 RepID=UPI003013C4BD
MSGRLLRLSTVYVNGKPLRFIKHAAGRGTLWSLGDLVEAAGYINRSLCHVVYNKEVAASVIKIEASETLVCLGTKRIRGVHRFITTSGAKQALQNSAKPSAKDLLRWLESDPLKQPAK